MQKVNNFSEPSTTYKIIIKQLLVGHFVLILIILVFKTSTLCSSSLEHVTIEAKQGQSNQSYTLFHTCSSEQNCQAIYSRREPFAVLSIVISLVQTWVKSCYSFHYLKWIIRCNTFSKQLISIESSNNYG